MADCCCRKILEGKDHDVLLLCRTAKLLVAVGLLARSFLRQLQFSRSIMVV